MFGYVHGGSTEQTTNRFKRSQNLKKDKKVEMAPRKQNQGHRRSNRRGGAGNGRSCSNCPTPSENFYTTLNQYPIIKECLNWPRNQNIPQKLMETCQELVPVIKEEVGRKYAAAHQKVEMLYRECVDLENLLRDPSQDSHPFHQSIEKQRMGKLATHLGLLLNYGRYLAALSSDHKVLRTLANPSGYQRHHRLVYPSSFGIHSQSLLSSAAPDILNLMTYNYYYKNANMSLARRIYDAILL